MPDARRSCAKHRAGAAAAAPVAVTPERAALRARCWGTRGSIPSPGHGTAHFGGNTSCLEVRTSEDRRIIFDAGTGIRPLGQHIVEHGGGAEIDLFLTHFHWDHVQGLPFFAPLYDPGARICIHGARQGERDVESIIRAQLDPVHFPIPFSALESHIGFRHLDEGPWAVGRGVRVEAFRVRHAASTYGYRIHEGDVSIAYIPDNELVGGRHEVDQDPRWYDRLVEFLDGVDLLFHDATFTEAEHASREGWGHSTFRQVIELARRARVARLYFFHHAPDRRDEELLEILEEVSADLPSGSPLRLGIAAEGEELRVHAAPS